MATFPDDTLDLSALFRSCVDCFGAIRYDDSLEADTHGHLLRLHCIGLNFTQWGYSRGLPGDGKNLRSDLHEFRPLLEIVLQSIKDQFRWARIESEGFDQGFEVERTWTLDQRRVLRNLAERVKSEVDALLWLFPEHVAISQNHPTVVEPKERQDSFLSISQNINEGTSPRYVKQPLFKDSDFALGGNYSFFRTVGVPLSCACLVFMFALGSCFVPFLSDSCA